jgi:23S rRNA pseudouridine955/2504/2580 synthase
MKELVAIAIDEDDGVRLDRWFKRYKPEITHSLLQKLLRKGLVRVNKRKVETSYRVKEGDEIILKDIGLQEPERATSYKMPVNVSDNDIKDFQRMVIFENNDYIIINKPPGLASQGGTGIKMSVDDMIRSISERYKLVHRLDRDTSGVLVIGKKTTAASKFAELLKYKQVTKIYWALVLGRPPQQKGVIKLALMKKGADKNGKGHQKIEVDEAEGKKAITEYTILEDLGGKMTWLELSPITGRMHQLRVHCASMGCPIIGDGKYGGADVHIKGMERKLHLHARRIIIDELNIDVTAPLPKHMELYTPDI